MGFLKKVMAAASSGPAAAGNRRPTANPQYIPYQPPAREDASTATTATPVARPTSNAAAVAASAYAASPSAGGPVKYIKVAGVMRLNPEYKAWQEKQQQGKNDKLRDSMPNSKHALPVVSSMEDHAHLNADLGTNMPLAESTDATIERMQTPRFSKDTGMNPDTIVSELGSMLSKYEVPLGLINKLMMLSEYQILEFIIDDSGSMQCPTDTIDPVTRKPMTRWKEAQIRLKEMIEILAYIPFNTIVIEFLNRKDQIILTRQGRTPPVFIQDAYTQIDAIFPREPTRYDTTPYLEKIQQSLIRGQGKSIARYFFGDGVPNGGERAQREIVNIIKNRQDPVSNPITFISCTNEDDQVEWMKDAEEVCPFCSESDDFRDEGLEVLKDQGAALPYTKGFHIICTLVAAMNPDDLDAMDESVPFTKNTLDNLLGIEHEEASYRYYFDCFVKAQRAHRVQGPADQLKKNVQWNYNDFLLAPRAKDIPQVQYIKQQLASIHR